jgi:pectinesterase
MLSCQQDHSFVAQGCELHVVPDTPGSLTAQKREKNDSASGFVFIECTIGGLGTVYLGRAWGRYSRVVFLYTFMQSIIMPLGWDNWGDARRNGYVKELRHLRASMSLYVRTNM